MKDWLEDLWDSIQFYLELAIEFIITWFAVAIIILGTILIGVAIHYILFKICGVVV